jgi:hypothetical protein
MLKTITSTANTVGSLEYKGLWNAATNTPTLVSSVGTQGDYYVVSVAGTTNLDGVTTWDEGDWAIFNGSVWQLFQGGQDGVFATLTVSGEIAANGGIDVTGTATMDGLTVDGGVTTSVNLGSIAAGSSSNVFINKGFDGAGKLDFASGNTLFSAFRINVDSLEAVSFDWNYDNAVGLDRDIKFTADGSRNLLNLNSNGDVSLYEDTGTTAKFFWDASTEILTTAGLDVTGTATMDGLTVDGVGALTSSGTELLDLTSTGGDSLIRFGPLNSNFDARIGSPSNGSSSPSSLVMRTSGDDRLLIDGTTGDISFYEDTGSSPKFVWDASDEKLTISGTGGLTVSKTTGPIIKLESTGTGAGAGTVIGDLQFYGNDASTPGAGIKASITATAVAALGDDSQLMFSTSDGTTNNVNRMLIANNGDVSFYENTGTTPKFVWDSSAESLDISGAGGLTVDAGVQITSNVGFNAALGGRLFKMGTHGLVLQGVTGSTNDFAVTTPSGQLLIANPVGTNDVVLIPSASGNVLVGTTSDLTDAYLQGGGVGIALRSNDQLAVSRSGSTVAQFNRNTNDGDIVAFRKEGTTVGSIGVALSDNLYFSGVDAGIGCGTGAIYPASTTGQSSDNDTDLGTASTRFKDLYLSSGVYLGGTGAANKLDDYEEGTWTPVFKRSGSTNNATIVFQDANYVKSGKQVTVTVYVTSIDYSPVTDGTFAAIEGLPFTSDGWHSGSIGYGGATNVSETTWVLNGVTGSFLSASGNGFYNGNPDLNRGMFTVTYITV